MWCVRVCLSVENTQCFAYWIDSSDRDRLEESLYWLYRFLAEIMSEEPEVKLLIMLNKQDLPHALTRDELLARINTPTPARNREPVWYQDDGVIPARLAMEELLGAPAGVAGGRWQVQPCVATTGEGLYEGLDWMLGTGDGGCPLVLGCDGMQMQQAFDDSGRQ